MTPDDNDDRFAEYLDQYASYLKGESDRPVINRLGPEDHRELSAMFRIIEASWASAIELPPFEEDPVALALGLVPSASTNSPVMVAGSRVRALRQAMNLSRSDLVTVISTQGWPITPPEIAVLERADAEQLPAAQAAALARALRTGIEALAPGPEDPVGEFVTWLYSDEFDHVVADWAARHERAADPVAKEVRTKMLAPTRRSSGPNGRTQWLQTLRAILEAME